MSRPEFERVLSEHLPRDRYRDDGECVGTYCTCGQWSGDYFADGESGPFDAHLAAALNAEVGRWLADEGTRERVASGVVDGCESVGVNDYISLDDGRHIASFALAALTPDPTDDDRMTTASEGAEG